MRPAFILLCMVSAFGAAQTAVNSSMDWSSGELRISASRPLDSDISPADHPRALNAMERELTPLIISELERLSWDRRGTLADLVSRKPILKDAVEKMALAVTRSWSRLSADGKSVEALYTLSPGAVMSMFFPPEEASVRSRPPIGWVQVPEDPWSGILIYVPPELTSRLVPALRARVLGSDITVLADPAALRAPALRYYSLEDRAAAESLVGRRPYRTTARALYGESPCDIILGEDDMRRITASPSTRRALEEGLIAVLTAP